MQLQVQQETVTSEITYSIRTYILLLINVIGALACLLVYVLLALTAVGVIFKENEVSPIVKNYLREFENTSHIIAEEDFYQCSSEDCPKFRQLSKSNI